MQRMTLTDFEWMDHMQRRLRCVQAIVIAAIVVAVAWVVL